MKENLHPDYHKITVVMTDGTEFETRSTYGQAGSKLALDIDPKSHPAWTGMHRLVDRGGQLAKFNKRFAGLGNKEEAPAGAPGAAAPAEAPVEKIKLTTSAASVAKSKKKV